MTSPISHNKSSDVSMERNFGSSIPSLSSQNQSLAFGRSATLLDAGEIRFVNLLVRRPCLVAIGTLMMLVVCLFGLGAVAANEGAEVFAAEGGDDLDDLRTRRRD